MSDTSSKTVIQGVIGDAPWKRYKLISIMLAVAGILPVIVLVGMSFTLFKDHPQLSKLLPIIAAFLLVTDLGMAGVFWMLDKRQRKMRVTDTQMVEIDAHDGLAAFTETLTRYNRLELRQMGRTQSWFIHGIHPDPDKSFSSAPFVGKARVEIELDRIKAQLPGITIHRPE
ncbi:MAG: hypothetical protein Alpg2KO_15080 [Alphaproteobacteria bacterium]